MKLLNQLVLDQLGVLGLADAYKPSHPYQYPADTNEVTAYMEARKNTFLKSGLIHPAMDGVVFFGPAMFFKTYMSTPITLDNVNRCADFWEKVGVPFPEDDVKEIVKDYDGYLPVEVKALPEGTFAPIGVPLVKIKNLDSKYPWLPAYIETIHQENIWYPTSVCTLSWYTKVIQTVFHMKSSDESLESLAYKLHDFGFRATTCVEQACIGGTSHAVNYSGSDTSIANIVADHIYDCSASVGDVATHSIPAMEHMTSTAWKKKNEEAAIRNFIEKFCCNGGMGSIIIDTYSTNNVVNYIVGEKLKNLIETKVKDSGGCVVLRPDSGDPSKVPVEVIKDLMSIFGYTTNSKGYKVLPPYVRVIQGDGMTLESIINLYNLMNDNKLSLDNICVGQGGGLLQKVNRDTFGFAQKGCWIKTESDPVGYGISKDPVTDPGKKSKEGDVDVYYDDDGNLKWVDSEEKIPEGKASAFRTIYKYRPIVTAFDDFDTIRKRAASHLAIVVDKIVK